MDTTGAKTTWLEELWPRLASASGVGYLATAYLVSRWLTRRSSADLAAPTSLAGLRILPLTIETSDDVMLRGWCVEPERPRATIALFHGMRQNRAAMLERIDFLSAVGYRCIAFDHRAHGESSGRFTSFGYHERHDVEAVAELIHTHWPNEPCAALGASMGAAAICFAGERAHAFDALILESLYHDLARAFQHRVGSGYPSWFWHFRRGIIWFTERRLGARIGDVAPVSQIARLAPRPVLLITGSDDPHAPPHEARALADQIPEFSQLHVVSSADHHNVCEQGGQAYRLLLFDFLESRLFHASPRLAA
jgi:pimeloyl-ACP methyl ester carboxylesterase